MATELATAYVSLVPSFRGGRRQIAKELGTATAGLGEREGRGIGSRLASGIGKAAKGGALAAGGLISGALVQGFRRLSAIENAEATLRGLGLTAKDAADVTDQALQSVLGTSHRLDDAAQVAAMAVTSGIKPGKELDSVLRSVAGAATVAQTDMSEMGGIFQVVAASNRLTMTEVNRLSQRGIPTLAALADHMGVSQDAAREMVSAGEVDFKTFNEAIGEFVGDAAQEAGTTTTATFKNMGAAIARWGASLWSGVWPLIQPFFQGIIDFFDRLIEASGPMSEAFGAWITDTAIPNLQNLHGQATDVIAAIRDSDVFNDSWDKLRDIWDKLVQAAKDITPGVRDLGTALGNASAAVGINTWQLLLAALDLAATLLNTAVVPAFNALAGWLKDNEWAAVALVAGFTAWRAVMIVSTAATLAKAAAMRILNAAMRANPIGIIITLLVALVAGIITAYKTNETFRKIVQKVWDAVKRAFTAAWENVIKPVIEAIVSYYKWVWERAVNMKDRVVNAWNAIKDGIGKAWDWIKRNVIEPWVDRFTWMRDKLIQVKDKILDTFRNLRDTLGRVFRQAIDRIKSPIRSAFKWINKNLIDNLNKVTTKFGLTIPKLPEKFHTGGIIPGRGETIITALGGEGVVSPRGMRVLGKAGLDAINDGRLPHGGPLDWVRDNIADPIVRGVKAIGSQVGDWLRQGAAFALDKIMGLVIRGANAMPGGFTRDFITGTLNELRPLVKAWGEQRDELDDETAPGSNLPAFIANSGWARPIGAGYRVGRGSRAHGYPALDLPAPVGTPIYAAAAGRVIQSLDSAVSYGKRVMIAHSIGRGVYAHMSQRLAQTGDAVRAGQLIGRVGSTGNSTGPHLHLELGRYDPLSFLRAKGVRFDRGGTLAPGLNLIDNATGGPETLRRVGLPNDLVERRVVIELHGDGSRHADFLIEELRYAARTRAGGDVQVLLGGRR